MSDYYFLFTQNSFRKSYSLIKILIFFGNLFLQVGMLFKFLALILFTIKNVKPHKKEKILNTHFFEDEP